MDKKKILAVMIVSLLFVTLSGCDQTYRQGLEILCDPEEHVGPDDFDTDEPTYQDFRDAIDDKITNEDAREVYETMGQVPPEQREDYLEEKVEEAGISMCPILYR